jgi:type II secretory pathway predicted ATPase ExeA
MYTTYYGLKENPFNLTPDPRYLFLSRRHQEALSHLRYGIKEKKGFILITGKIGTGKTTLIRSLLSDLDRNVKTALIFNAYISDREILHAINQEFGIPSDNELTNKQCIDLLNTFLIKCYEKGENAVLFLDEAQNLSSKVLEQIRMLSNLETEKEKLLQIVMVGQNELKDILNASGLRQLNERITVRYDLDTLKRKDVRSYVIHRLTVAGAKGMIHFTRWAFRALYRASKGNPRIINAICDRALLIAYSRDKFTIDREIINQAALNVKGQRYIYNGHRRSFRKLGFTCAIFLIAFFAFMGGWYFQNQWFIHWVQDVFKIEMVTEPFQPPVKNNLPDQSTVIMASEPKPVTSENIETTQSETKQLSEHTDNLSANAFISRMTQVTGDIILTQSEQNELSKTAMNSVSVSQVSVESVELSITTQKEKESLTLVTSEPDNITEMNQSDHLSLTKNLKPERAIEFSTFKPFYQVDNRQSRLGLSMDTMDTVAPDYFENKENTHSDKSDQDDNLAFFLGDPWEKGMTAPEIMWVQKTLNSSGYPVKITGTYSKETVSAIKQLQADFGLDVDGIIGPQSKWALYQLSTTKLHDYYQLKNKANKENIE